jgi:hypothetical protein
MKYGKPRNARLVDWRFGIAKRQYDLNDIIYFK